MVKRSVLRVTKNLAKLKFACSKKAENERLSCPNLRNILHVMKCRVDKFKKKFKDVVEEINKAEDDTPCKVSKRFFRTTIPDKLYWHFHPKNQKIPYYTFTKCLVFLLIFILGENP